MLTLKVLVLVLFLDIGVCSFEHTGNTYVKVEVNNSVLYNKRLYKITREIGLGITHNCRLLLTIT